MDGDRDIITKGKIREKQRARVRVVETMEVT